jgi:hypothetical protein
MFRNRERILKIGVWVVVIAMILTIMAAIVPLVS